MQLTADSQSPSLKKILIFFGWLLIGGLYSGLWVFFFSLSHAFWFLPAGLRFVAFMNTRPAHWPVFLVGEWLAIVYLNVEYDVFSGDFVLMFPNFLPSVIYAAVIGFFVWKKGWTGYAGISRSELGSISFVIVVAAVASAISLFYLMPGDHPFLVFEKFSIKGIFSYALGDVAGVLFAWSLVEFVKSFMAMDKVNRWSFARNASYLILPVATLFALLLPLFEWEVLALMFIPIVFLALNHGWSGATFSLTILNVIAGLVYWHSGNTGELFHTQVFLVSVGFTGLFLGAAVSRQAGLMKSISTMSQRVITTQETERNRIAKDVHDHIGQVLTALTLRVAILRQRAPAELENDFDILDQLAAQVFHDVHDIVGELSPRELSHFGLKQLLEGPVIQKMLSAANVTYSTAIDPGVADIPEQIQTAIFRISQEALTNIVRHSLATECGLKVSLLSKKGKRSVRLEIWDDGTGFESNVARKGHGLQNIMDRAQALMGNCDLSSDENGTILVVFLPV